MTTGAQGLVKIDPYAAELVKAACDLLAASDSFRVDAHADYDRVLNNGHKVQLSRDIDVTIRRPDKFYAEVVSDEGRRKVYYDGARVNVHHLDENVYAVIDAPDTIDETLDFLVDNYDVTTPLADLMTADPYENFTANTTAGFYVGLHYLDGEFAHHLAFETDAVDFQIWIASEGDPVIKKIVITYRHLDGAPQYVAVLKSWDRESGTSDALFEFAPPEGVDPIEFLSLNRAKVGEE